MKLTLLFNLWVLIFHSGLACAQKFSFIKSIPSHAKFFTTDKLGNFYLIENYEIKKFDPDGNFLSSYNYKNLGSIEYLDATDPFKIMLFQPEFLKIRTLDNKLTIQREVDLNHLTTLGLPRLACVADDGNFWIYDQQSQRLIKIEPDGKVLLTGNAFSQYISGELNFKNLTATEYWLLMSDADSSTLVFDKFGNYFRSMPTADFMSCQANGNLLYFLRGNRFHAIDINNLKETVLESPDLTGALEVRMEQHRMYVRRKDMVEVYSF